MVRQREFRQGRAHAKHQRRHRTRLCDSTRTTSPSSARWSSIALPLGVQEAFGRWEKLTRTVFQGKPQMRGSIVLVILLATARCGDAFLHARSPVGRTIARGWCSSEPPRRALKVHRVKRAAAAHSLDMAAISAFSEDVPPTRLPGMAHVLFIETGFGADQHGQNATKAAVRACRNAIEFNSIPSIAALIPGGYERMALRGESLCAHEICCADPCINLSVLYSFVRLSPVRSVHRWSNPPSDAASLRGLPANASTHGRAHQSRSPFRLRMPRRWTCSK